MDDSTTDDSAESSDAADGPDWYRRLETSADASESETETEAETDAEWMEPADKPILEFLRSEDAFEPDQIDDEDRPGQICGLSVPRDDQVRAPDEAHARRLRGVELGERYLEGTLDPSELEADK